MLVELPAVLLVEVPNETQARSLRADLEALLRSPVVATVLRAHGVRNFKIGEARPPTSPAAPPPAAGG